MATHIVLIRAGNIEFSRKFCEHIENTTYDDLNSFLNSVGCSSDISVYSLSEFMDLVNDQELDNLEGYFLTYITIL